LLSHANSRTFAAQQGHTQLFFPMSSGAVSRHLNGGGSLLVSCAPIDDDRSGDWTIEQLIDMDLAFRAAIERAFALGLESPAAAAATQRFRQVWPTH
jgi:hypothetical protein